MFEYILNKLSPEMFYLGFLFGIPLLFVAIKRPDICFALGFPAYLFLGQLSPFYPISNSAGAAIFPFIAILGNFIRGRKPTFRICEALMFILAIWMIYSISYSSYQNYGKEKVILFCFIIFPLVAFAPYIIHETKELKTVLSIISITLIIYILISALLQEPIHTVESRASQLLDLTRAGQFLGLTALLGFSFHFYGKYNVHLKFLSISIIFFSIMLLLMTGTRGAFLSLILCLIFLYWFQHDYIKEKIVKRTGHMYIKLLLLFLISIALLYYLRMIFPDEILSRFFTFQGFFSGLTYDEFINWRFSQNRVLNFLSAVEAFLESPLRGVGAGGYIGVLGNYIHLPIDLIRGELSPAYPHNLILELSVEQGIVGTMLIMAIIFYNIKYIREMRMLIIDAESRYYIIISVGIYMYGLLLSMTSLDIPRMMIFWWGMGLLLSANSIYNTLSKKIVK